LNANTPFDMESPLPPRLQDLLSQLSKVPALLEHELKYLLQAPPAAPVPIAAAPSPEVAQVKDKLAELWREIEQADAQLIKYKRKQNNHRRDENINN